MTDCGGLWWILPEQLNNPRRQHISVWGWGCCLEETSRGRLLLADFYMWIFVNRSSTSWNFKNQDSDCFEHLRWKGSSKFFTIWKGEFVLGSLFRIQPPKTNDGTDHGCQWFFRTSATLWTSLGSRWPHRWTIDTSQSTSKLHLSKDQLVEVLRRLWWWWVVFDRMSQETLTGRNMLQFQSFFPHRKSRHPWKHMKMKSPFKKSSHWKWWIFFSKRFDESPPRIPSSTRLRTPASHHVGTAERTGRGAPLVGALMSGEVW